MTDRSSDAKPPAVWAEHTVVASLPRLFPGARASHPPLSDTAEPRTLIGMPKPQPPEPQLPSTVATPARESQPSDQVAALAAEPVPPSSLGGLPLALAEEPRTVVGRAPSRTTAQQLLARYAELASAAHADSEDGNVAANIVAPPVEQSWLRRAVDCARDDFRRAPRIVRLLLPALPLVAAATTFLDVDPSDPALSRAVVAATTTAVVREPPPPASDPLPASSVSVAPRPGHTLASDAADAAARGDREQAIAIYAQLAREQPHNSAYASAARILLRDEARNRPHPRQ